MISKLNLERITLFHDLAAHGKISSGNHLFGGIVKTLLKIIVRSVKKMKRSTSIVYQYMFVVAKVGTKLNIVKIM
jgi:hypothetical protein